MPVRIKYIFAIWKRKYGIFYSVIHYIYSTRVSSKMSVNEIAKYYFIFYKCKLNWNLLMKKFCTFLTISLMCLILYSSIQYFFLLFLQKESIVCKIFRLLISNVSTYFRCHVYFYPPPQKKKCLSMSLWMCKLSVSLSVIQIL